MNSLYPVCCASLVYILGIFFLLKRWRKAPSTLPLPPGPRKIPFLGNLLDFPSSFEWETFQRWGKEYDSDILHLNAAGTSLIVLNSIKAANDLLDRRSSLYSNRPKFTLVSKIMGFSWLLPFMPYGAAWKERRRLFVRHFHPSNDNIHKPLEIEYTRRLLVQLLETPEDYIHHVRHSVSGMLLSVAYGTKTEPSGDPFVNLAEEVSGYLSDSAIPATMLLDAMPFLAPIISPFLSGPAFRKSRQDWQELVSKFRDDPFCNVQKLMCDGMAEPSFISNALEELPSTKDNESEHGIIKDVAGVVFIGGSSTTNAVLHTFFLAMTLFPTVQARAQEELDRIVGRGRLPDFQDEPHLPYLGALLKEVHRWRTAGPLGIPHFLEKDDEYNGYLIPGQSVVIPNAWAMLNNEDDYPNPTTFKPERFLKNGYPDLSVRDPATIVFGFGRRACPGMHIAHSTIWITAASILSAFEISAPLDEKGVRIEPSGEYHSAVTFQPLPFKCVIKPRHGKAEALIRDSSDA